MTVRSEGQFNTVVYEEEDVYPRRHAPRRRLHGAEDAAARGSGGRPRRRRDGDGPLEVRSWTAPIRPGNVAMFYPRRT
jgi:hypothetical protein